MVEQRLLDVLACPVCKGPVVPEDDRLICKTDGLAFPVRDGIPVMLVDQADKIDTDPDS